MLMKFKVGRGCTTPSLLTWSSTKKSDGKEELMMTGSMDDCSILLETQFVSTCLLIDTTQILSVGDSLTPKGAAREKPEFDSKLPLGAPVIIFSQGYLLTYFPQRDTSARQQGFEIRVFPLQGELPKAIEPHLPICQLYRWQLGTTMLSLTTTKSLDSIVVTAIRVGSQGKPRTRHMWICLQLSGARGMDNGGVMAINRVTPQ